MLPRGTGHAFPQQIFITVNAIVSVVLCCDVIKYVFVVVGCKIPSRKKEELVTIILLDVSHDITQFNHVHLIRMICSRSFRTVFLLDSDYSIVSVAWVFSYCQDNIGC